MKRAIWIGMLACFACYQATGSDVPNGSLSGLVTDSSGAIITNAEIFIHWNFARAGGPAKPSTGDLSLKTDKHGRYAVNLIPGFYDVCTHSTAFSPACETVRITSGQVISSETHLKVSRLFSNEYGDDFSRSDEVPVIPSKLPDSVTDPKVSR